jgi:hypothetical protein
MAFNFAETFLRESGAAQDRSRSMAEMQLRAKQFADEMVLKEADLAVRKEAQRLAENVAAEAALFRVMDLNQQETQFNANLQQRVTEFNSNLELKGKELGLTEKQIDQEKELFTSRLNEESEARKAQIKLAYDQLSSQERLTLSKLGFDREMFYSDQDFKRPRQEAETAAIIATTERADALATAELAASRVETALSQINLNRQNRGEAYLTEQASEKTKTLLGLNPEDDLTNERAGNLLQTRILEEGLQQKQAATKLSELRTNLEIQPYSQEITQENIKDVSNSYSEDVRRSGLRTAYDQFVYTFLNPATAFDVRAKIDFVTAGFGIPAKSVTGKYYDLQRATGVDAAEFANPLAGPQGLLGRSLMESQMTPAQQEYYNYLNRSASLFADPTKEFTQGAYQVQPPFPIPFGPYTNPSSLIPPMMSQDVEE